MRSALIFILMVGFFVGCSEVNNPTAPTSAKSPVKTGTWDRVAATPNYYQAWTAGGGSMNAQNLGNGHYSVSWSGVSDIVVGSGWNPMPSGQSVTWSGSESGAQYFGVYGWMTNPLTEYYIGRGGGNNVGSYSVSTGTYSLNTVSCNGANINGNGPFQQFNCSGNGGSGIVPSDHWSKWAGLGHGVSGANYCIVSVEAWGGSSGNANITVGSGSSSGGSSSGGSSSGGSSSGGGSGQINLNSWQCNSHSSGLNIWTGGVGNWSSGAWIEFNGVNLNGETGINFNLATTGSGQFAIRIDGTNGTTIGTLGYGSTGGWNTYQNKSTSLNGASGTHNLYIVDTGGAANVGTITVY
jgi:endo-1,4-beta-xylanase